MCNIGDALVRMLAVRSHVHELPIYSEPKPLTMALVLGVGVYVWTGQAWAQFHEDDERAEEVISAVAVDVMAEYPSRWQCSLACGCHVETQRSGDVAPSLVRHWCRASHHEAS